jgi:predicted metal-dependent phosphoesterase TrpH
LLNRKVVSSFEEAFQRFLGKGCPAYVPKTRLPSKESIDLIHAAGGLAILAHPIQLKLEGEKLEALVKSLRDQGLDGLEVFHSDHDAKHEAIFSDLAKRLGLRISGGSDYHGIPGRSAELGHPALDEALALELFSEYSR